MAIRANSEIGMMVNELIRLVGPTNTIAMLVHVLEEVQATGAFPQGLALNIDESKARGEDFLLMELAMRLAPPAY